MCLERRRGPRDLLGERASRNSAGPLSSVDVSVSFHWLSSNLPPTCPRTRLKGARSSTSAAELRLKKTLQMSGEGGFEPPVPLARHGGS